MQPQHPEVVVPARDRGRRRCDPRAQVAASDRHRPPDLGDAARGDRRHLRAVARRRRARHAASRSRPTARSWRWAGRCCIRAQDAALHAYLQGTVHPDWRRPRHRHRAASGGCTRARPRCSPRPGRPAAAAIFQYVDEGNTDAATLGERLGLRDRAVVHARCSATCRSRSTRRRHPRASSWSPTPPTASADVLEARNDAFRDHWGSLPSTPRALGAVRRTGRSCAPTCRRSRWSTGGSWRSASHR